MFNNSMLLSFLFNLPAFMVAIVVHEYAHGYIAHKLGDDTAKYMGRLTFNPLAHIDLFGTLILPIMLIISGSPFVVGWAKPVPVNFYNLRNPKRSMVWVGVAGPAANFITAGATYILLRTVIIRQELLINFLVNVYLINLILGVFNLIPIPPLDGSRILIGLLPEKWALMYARIKPLYGIIILIILLTILRGIL